MDGTELPQSANEVTVANFSTEIGWAHAVLRRVAQLDERGKVLQTCYENFLHLDE